VNPELLNKALVTVGNPNTLVNLIARRVRQLNYGGGGISRPLISNIGNLGVADVALREIVEGKMGWEMPEVVPLTRLAPKRRKRH